MAQKHAIYVYDQNCIDFTTTGLVGDLKPMEAIFTEQKNGESQIVIKMSYDDFQRWKACKPGNLIKAEVPVRVPPVIRNDEYANTVDISVGQGAN